MSIKASAADQIKKQMLEKMKEAVSKEVSTDEVSTDEAKTDDISKEELALRLERIILYDNITSVDPVYSLKKLLSFEGTIEEKTSLYHRFLKALYQKGADLGQYLSDALRCDDNEYIRLKAGGKEVPQSMQACFEQEMKTFSRLSALRSQSLLKLCGLDETAPRFENTRCDFTREIPQILSRADRYGYGIFARYSMFRVDDDAKVVPVLSPDPITIDELVGYQDERGRVLNNVYALLKGKPAANMLLVGDAGTGKSSTVKAICNQLCGEGVRLLEIRKDQLKKLPEIVAQIADNPLKFVLFIDDLSFDPDDEQFGSLKAVLEGSAAAKTPNAIICATSNRRHIVKETFSSREGDEIHRRDTIEEQTSLSARFGLTVLFVKPNKDLYLKIVRNLVEEAVKRYGEENTRDLIPDDTELARQAEVFAIAKGGRSARVARQFVDSLLASGSI